MPPRRVRSGVVGLLGAVGIALLTGGCAERRLLTRPESAPDTATWTAVWMAGALAAVVWGVLITLPAWRARGGARLAAAVLTVQAGAAAVTGVVLAAVGVRSWQLIGQPVDAEPAIALLRLSSIDGDTAFLAAMVVVVVVLSTLLATLTAVAARLASGTDPLERSLVSALLAVELGASGYAIVRLVLGAHGLPYLATALAFPVLVVAFATCWPRTAATARS